MLLEKHDDLNLNFDNLPVSDFWTKESTKSFKMHKIHWYPAKYPAYLVEKSLQYAKENNISIKNVVDIFCGCGTTPLESKRLGYNFWGCDINPVATLIANVKSKKYNPTMLSKYYVKINEEYLISKATPSECILYNQRLNYWYPKEQIIELNKLLSAIKNIVPKGKYRDFFLCAFSNILRGCSRWLTKSIKPQIDPNKRLQDVLSSFKKQYKAMFNANEEIMQYLDNKNKIIVTNDNYLDVTIKENFADVVITSPPYVTSYEYADLHQLSTLWLGFVEDYRDLRNGTVGSLHHADMNIDVEKDLNSIAQDILAEIQNKAKSKAKSIAKYFYDIKKTVEKTYTILNTNSMAFFVIGNTQYKGVHIDNAKYLTRCLMDNGFVDIEVYKREIGNKILTRYRDSKGKFTTDVKARKVYNVEFIVIAKKKNERK